MSEYPDPSDVSPETGQQTNHDKTIQNKIAWATIAMAIFTFFLLVANVIYLYLQSGQLSVITGQLTEMKTANRLTEQALIATKAQLGLTEKSYETDSRGWLIVKAVGLGQFLAGAPIKSQAIIQNTGKTPVKIL